MQADGEAGFARFVAEAGSAEIGTENPTEQRRTKQRSFGDASGASAGTGLVSAELRESPEVDAKKDARKKKAGTIQHMLSPSIAP